MASLKDRQQILDIKPKVSLEAATAAGSFIESMETEFCRGRSGRKELVLV